MRARNQAGQKRNSAGLRAWLAASPAPVPVAFATFGVMLSGAAIMLGGTILSDMDRISGLVWMILTGLGAYLTYVPFCSVPFDCMIASMHVVGTSVFAIYVADALGYTGSVAMQLHKDFGQAGSVSWFDFFHAFTYFMSGLGLVLLAGSCAYFAVRHLYGRRHQPATEVAAA